MTQVNEDLNRILEESTESIVYKVGFDDKITYVTPSVKGLFGYEPQELIGADIKTVLTPESYRRQREGMLKALADPNNKGEVMIVDVVVKDGTKMSVELYARFERDAEGKPTGIMGVAKAVKVSAK